MRCEVSTFPPATAARRTRIDHCPRRGNHSYGPHQARGRRHIFCQQAPKDIKASRIGNRLDGIDASLDLRIRPSEINGDRVAAGDSPALILNLYRRHNLDRPIADSIVVHEIFRPISPLGKRAKNARIIRSE